MKNDPTLVRDSNSCLKLLTFQLSNVRELETIKYTFDSTLGCKFFCAEHNLGILRRGPHTTQDTHVINFYLLKRSLFQKTDVEYFIIVPFTRETSYYVNHRSTLYQTNLLGSKSILIMFYCCDIFAPLIYVMFSFLLASIKEKQ